MRVLLGVGLASLAVTSAAAQTGAATPSLPTPPPLPDLLGLLRTQVPDARTISDMQVCPPVKVSRDRTRYTVMVAFSRLNTARHFYGVRVRDGRYAELMDTQLSADMLNTPSGLMGLAARSTARQFESCRWVSPEELQAAWAQLDRR